MHDTSYDLAVIGGGPAGSSAARRAAQLGLKVLLLEKRAMPRMKPCGGALSEAALRQLGFELPPALINSQIRGACVHYRRHASSARVERRIAVLVSREDFDALLLEMARRAGTVCETATAKSLTRQGQRVLITTGERVFSASAVIIAQGAAGNLIRHVRRPDQRGACGLCMTSRIAVPQRDPFAQSPDLVDIHFGVVKRGYGWLFHHGRYYSVGIGGTLPLRQPYDALRTFCTSLGIDPPPPNAVRGHLIPRGGVPRVLVGGRMLLAGDAAGFVDPFCGEGLAYTIRSGQIAAEVVAQAIRHGDLSAANLRAYEQRCEAEFGRSLRWALRVANVMHTCPWPFMRLLAGNRRVLRGYLESLLARSYDGFLLWLARQMPRELIFGLTSGGESSLARSSRILD